MAEPVWVDRPSRIDGGYWRVHVWNPLTRKKVWATNANNSQRFESKLEAYNARAILQRQIDRDVETHGQVPSTHGRTPTFAKVAEQWKHAHPAVAKNSANAQTRLVRMLIQDFGTQRIDELTAEQVRTYFSRLSREGYAASTRAQRLQYFRKVMAYAISEGLRSDDPSKDIASPNAKIRKRQPVYLSDQQMLELGCHLPRGFWPALLLSYDCGLRAGEIAGLRWHRLQLDGNDPHVIVQDVCDVDGTLREYPKGNDENMGVALTPRAVRALKDLRAWRGQVGTTDRVFLNHFGHPLRADVPNEILRRAFEHSGLGAVVQRPVWHHHRHACAYGLDNADAPHTVIQAVLRHGSLETTGRYLRSASTKRQREWMARRDQQGAEVIELDEYRAS